MQSNMQESSQPLKFLVTAGGLWAGQQNIYTHTNTYVCDFTSDVFFTLCAVNDILSPQILNSSEEKLRNGEEKITF